MFALPDIGPLLTVADFEPHVGQDFLVDTTPTPLRMRLEKIMPGPNMPSMLRQPFILIFTTPWSDLLIQANYRMQPHGGRQTEMYISPTQTAPGERRYYHAVFS